MSDLGKYQQAYYLSTLSGKTLITFRLPKVIHYVLQDIVDSGGWSNLSSYYIHLSGFKFYQKYHSYYEKYLENEKGAIKIDDLLSGDSILHDLQKVESYGFHTAPITSQKCPKVLLELSEYLRECTGSKMSRNLFFRMLTVPFVIDELKEKILEKIDELEAEID